VLLLLLLLQRVSRLSCMQHWDAACRQPLLPHTTAATVCTSCCWWRCHTALLQLRSVAGFVHLDRQPGHVTAAVRPMLLLVVLTSVQHVPVLLLLLLCCWCCCWCCCWRAAAAVRGVALPAAAALCGCRLLLLLLLLLLLCCLKL
jgi:hypothetical protein